MVAARRSANLPLPLSAIIFAGSLASTALFVSISERYPPLRTIATREEY